MAFVIKRFHSSDPGWALVNRIGLAVRLAVRISDEDLYSQMTDIPRADFDAVLSTFTNLRQQLVRRKGKLQWWDEGK